MIFWIFYFYQLFSEFDSGSFIDGGVIIFSIPVISRVHLRWLDCPLQQQIRTAVRACPHGLNLVDSDTSRTLATRVSERVETVIPPASVIGDAALVPGRGGAAFLRELVRANFFFSHSSNRISRRQKKVAPP